jgi:hypothetical protein
MKGMVTAKASADTGLDALLRTRFRGAVNIRGIRYQILYSALLALRLYQEEGQHASVRLEGIEDVDLLGLHVGTDYVQIKTAHKPWNWARLKAPIAGFLEALRADPESRFSLALSFQPRDDTAKLAGLHSLPLAQQPAVRKKFRKLCRDVGGSADEADLILDRLKIKSLSEDSLWPKLRRALIEAWGLGSGAADVYIAALVNKLLTWAKDRATITREDLDRVRVDVGEALSREAEFQAYGRGMIDRISWAPDVGVADFLEGKGTRSGHIGAALDVPRPQWSERIDGAVNAAGVCVLRAPSGQGKSVLAYRYALDRWPHEDTFELRTAHTPEQVDLVRNYLEFRARAGLLTYLLIDDAGYQTQLWPAVAQACSAVGIPVIVTARNEDWYRFARRTPVSYEVVDPSLDLNEARQLYRMFRSAGRLHPSVDSAEWAYERIGEPHLLMEYVYLLTYGRMLEDRLRDQLDQIERLGEEPAKLEIVRRVALADTLAAPVWARELLRSVGVEGDPQRVLQSLAGEYVVLENGMLRGLHWVRSDHLAAILHEGYPDPADTALAVLPAVPPEYLGPFVANALSRPELDAEAFLRGLSERAQASGLDTLLAYLEGAFEAGERRYLEANRAPFDEAYGMVSSAGVFLVASALMPVVKTAALTDMARIVGPGFETFQKLSQLPARAVDVPRGLDVCRDLLESVAARLTSAALLADYGRTGRLLDWCYLTGVELPVWREVGARILDDPAVLRLPLDDFCAVTLGAYRYDELAYKSWLSAKRADILGYLKLRTDTLGMELTDDAVSIRFLPDPASEESANTQVMSRLTPLRSALPFCHHYRAQGEWILPLGLRPSHDGTYKDIPKENLHIPSDLEKNVVWRRVVEAAYLPDSYYRYQMAWHGIRLDALRLAETLRDGLRRVVVGRSYDFHAAFEQGELLVRLADRLNKNPDPPEQTPEPVAKALKQSAAKWEGNFQSFYKQIVTYVQDMSDKDAARRTISNFREAAELLPEMHSAFSGLFAIVPDYFGARDLDGREAEAYGLLGELLEVWIQDPPPAGERNLKRYMRERRAGERERRLGGLGKALPALREAGVEVTLPSDVRYRHPFREVALTFRVEDPCHPEVELERVVEALIPVRDAADFFWLVPVYESARLLRGGYSFSALQLEELDKGNDVDWETVIPRDVPDGVMHLLPEMPYAPPSGIEVRNGVLGILLVLPTLAERRAAVEVLRSSPNAFERERYKQHETKLEEAGRVLVAAAGDVERELTINLGHMREAPEYPTVSDFLSSFHRDPGKRPFDEGCEPNNMKMAEVAEAIEVLACRRRSSA